jgi:hypothetical protein
MSELIEIESSDGPFMVRLIEWLSKQPEPRGDTVIRLNLAGRLARAEAALRKIAKPALGGKEQQWIAQEYFKE